MIEFICARLAVGSSNVYVLPDVVNPSLVRLNDIVQKILEGVQ
jgi:hypothetical protein